MIKKLNKKYFNMVEVAMAMAIIAIAVVSLMGLLPVAMKASKNSVSENSISNIASLMKIYIDEQYKKNDFNVFIDGTTVFADKEEKNADNETVEFDKKDDNSEKDKKFFEDSELENRGYQIYQGGDDNILGAYLFELYSGKFDEDTSNTKDGFFESTDFSGIVRIWVKPLDGDINIPYENSNVTIFTGDDSEDVANKKMPKSIGCTVFMRISWPADASYKNQEHRLFSFDYFKKD